MTHNTEIIVDENGIEILVGYNFQHTLGYHEEPENVATYVQPSTDTDLTSVEIIIKGVGVDILPCLTDRQKEHIISLLNYE